MTRNVIKTSKAPYSEEDPYSQAVISKNFVFVSGQGPINPITNKIEGDNIIEQTKYTLENIKNILESAGSGLDKVIKVNAYLSDIKDFDVYNKTYKEWFKPPYPARTTVGAVLTNIKIEIDVIAEK